MELFTTASERKIKENCDYLIKKIENGLFNIVVIFGGTRTGKTTLGFQMGKYIADGLKVPFSNEQIFFSSELLLQNAEKKQKGVFQLDEASFDLKSVDWHSQTQKDFNTYLDTAAKYNQTLIIILPYLEFLAYRIVRDIHTLGIQVDYDRKTFAKGAVQIFDRYQLFDKYNLLKQKYLRKSEKIKGDYARTKYNVSFIDIDAYDREKDLAIAKGQTKTVSKENQKMNKLIYDLTQSGIVTQSRIAEMMGVDRSAISMRKSKHKKLLTLSQHNTHSPSE